MTANKLGSNYWKYIFDKWSIQRQTTRDTPVASTGNQGVRWTRPAVRADREPAQTQ